MDTTALSNIVNGEHYRPVQHHEHVITTDLSNIVDTAVLSKDSGHYSVVQHRGHYSLVQHRGHYILIDQHRGHYSAVQK